MKYLKAGFFAALLVVALTSTALAQSDPSGAWELTIDSPQGANSVTLTLKQDGGKLTGDLSSQMGSTPVTGTYDAGAVALTAHIDVQGMSLEMGINGKVEADTLDGNVKFGDFGEFPFKGKRAAAGAVATPPAAPAPAAPTSSAAAATPGDVNGKWDVTLTIEGVGEVPIAADIKQEGSKLTGTLNGPAGEIVVNGTMTGSTLRLEFTAETPNGPIPIIMTGELGADGGFTGKASLAGMGEAPWKATRTK